MCTWITLSYHSPAHVLHRHIIAIRRLVVVRSHFAQKVNLIGLLQTKTRERRPVVSPPSSKKILIAVFSAQCSVSSDQLVSKNKKLLQAAFNKLLSHGYGSEELGLSFSKWTSRISTPPTSPHRIGVDSLTSLWHHLFYT